MRGAAAALAGLFVLAQGALAAPVSDDCIAGVAGANYTAPTDRYPHGALGDPYEYGGLRVRFRLQPPCSAGFGAVELALPQELVFEDEVPVLADLDRDGEPEILTVESHQRKGARLAVYARRGTSVVRVATTPHIGQRNRWLAQLGAADLDGDGAVEIAYIDRPHLAKRLRVWRFRDGALRHVADLDGLTNHRFGEPRISGGIRDCGQGAEIVTANADWSRLMITRLDGGRLSNRDGGPWTKAAEDAALACR